MVFWAVFTPLVLFFLLVPGYVVVAYMKHHQRQRNERPGTRLLNKERISAYYTSIRPILRERLQRRSSLNVPNAVKPPGTKHLRSSSAIAPSLLQTRTSKNTTQIIREGSRRNSSPTAILVTPTHRPDILETISQYQVQPCSHVVEAEFPDTLSPKDGREQRHFDRNNNGRIQRKSRHLLPQATPLYILHQKKFEPMRETPCPKVDLPEKAEK